MRTLIHFKATVLIVDDEPLMLRAIRHILERLEYNVLVANSGVEALAIVRDYPSPLHLLISDVTMPDMNGFELAQKLTNLLPSLKVIFTTGYLVEGMDISPQKAQFIQKPFSEQELETKVRESLNS